MGRAKECLVHCYTVKTACAGLVFVGVAVSVGIIILHVGGAEYCCAPYISNLTHHAHNPAAAKRVAKMHARGAGGTNWKKHKCQAQDTMARFGML